MPLQVERLWKDPTSLVVKNVEAHGLKEKIQVRLANGLEAFEEEDQVSVITIAGMGGRLIATILEEGLDKLGNVRLILQPNNRIFTWHLVARPRFPDRSRKYPRRSWQILRDFGGGSGTMKLSASDLALVLLCPKRSVQSVQKWQKKQLS